MVGVHISQLTIDKHQNLVFASLLLLADVGGDDALGFLSQARIAVHLRNKKKMHIPLHLKKNHFMVPPNLP